MPAAAVIPAPIAYIKVAAVKKLVVGSRVLGDTVCAGVSTGHPDSFFWMLAPAINLVGDKVGLD